MKRICTIVAMAGVLLLAVSAAQAQDLRVGYSADVDTLDPGNHRSRLTEGVLRNMYDGLLARTTDMQIANELAENWRQIDPTTYEFKLRQGVKFHNGQEMTAADVKFTFDRLIQDGAMDGQTSPRKSLLGPLSKIHAVDRYTVRMILSKPWTILPAFLPFQEVVQKDFVERVKTDGLATQVNGTGPFKLVEWRKGEAVIMERFDGYYGGSPDMAPVGTAKVDRVIFQVIPESASRVAALLAGNVHLIDNLPHHVIKRVKSNANTQVLATNGTRSFFIYINVNKAPFNDVRVRRAANFAVNRKLIIDKVLNGYATPLYGLLSPDAFGYNGDLPSYANDPEKVKALLAEAGHPNGIDVTLDVAKRYKEIAEVLAAVLTQSGVRIKVQVWERSVMRETWNPNKMKEHDRQLMLSSWGNGSLDPVGIFHPVMGTKARGNRSGYSNAKLDQLLEKAGAEINRGKRAELYKEAQAIVHKDAPLIFLWLPQDLYGAGANLAGWKPSPRGIIKLHDAYLK